MKLIAAMLITSALFIHCNNSPEGSTNTEGSGASMRPDSTGDTSHIKTSDEGGGGKYSSDTMPMQHRSKGADSTVLVQQDSAAIKMTTGTRDQVGAHDTGSHHKKSNH